MSLKKYNSSLDHKLGAAAFASSVLRRFSPGGNSLYALFLFFCFAKEKEP